MNHTKQGRRASRLKSAAWSRYCAEFRDVPKTSDLLKCPEGGCDYCRQPPFDEWRSRESLRRRRMVASSAPSLAIKAARAVKASIDASSWVAEYLRANAVL